MERGDDVAMRFRRLAFDARAGPNGGVVGDGRPNELLREEFAGGLDPRVGKTMNDVEHASTP